MYRHNRVRIIIMGKAKRKMRPEPPWWWTLDNDNCWFCKNRNNCGNCKLLKKQRAEERNKYERKERICRSDCW